MSVTIDSLDIQIRSSAGSAASNIDKLADSLGRLQQNAKLTVVSNNLTKLSDALGKLQVNSASLSAIKGLAGAMKSLSGIEKSSGLNSTLNSLKKLPEIISGLDVGTLGQFSSKMRELSSALAPLSKEISTVSAAFSKLPTRVRDMVSGVNKLKTATDKATQSQRKHNASLDKQGINLMATISNIQSYMGALQSVGQHISTLMADAIEWDGIQFRFGRAFGEDAEEVYAYAQKVNDVLGINMQQFMQYSSLYGSLLSGFGLAQEKVTTISVGLTELSYDIWAAYNDRFKTLEQASEAVRSAITGEIEPIRNAGIALTEASLQEYLESVGMASVSIEKLSEAQKAEVRYAAMVNAAMQQGIVGTYAKEMDTAEGAVRNLTQQLKTLGQALGSIFLPILQTVVPWITAFVELIYEGAVALMAMLGIPFQEISWDSASSGVGGLADSANEATDALGSAAKQAKKLKDYTMGFDELNVINPSIGAAGGGSGGVGGSGWGSGLELDTLWDDSLFANASKKVDELKSKIKEWFEEWKEEITVIGVALGLLSIGSLLGQLGDAIGLGELFIGTMSKIKNLGIGAIIVTLQYVLTHEFLDNYFDGEGFKEYVKAMIVSALGTWVLYSKFGKGGLILGLAVTAIVSLATLWENRDGEFTSEDAVVGLGGIATALGAIGLAWKAFKGTELFGWLASVFGLLKEGNSATSVLSTAFPKLASVVSKLGSKLGWIGAIIIAVVSTITFLVKNWEEVKTAAKNFFEENIAPKLERINKSWEKMKTTLEPVIKFFQDAVDWFKELFAKIGEFLGGGEGGGGIIELLDFLGWTVMLSSSIIGGALSSIMGAIENIVQVVSGAIDFIGGFVELLIGVFTGKDVDKAAEKMLGGLEDIFGGSIGFVVDPIKDLFSGKISWFKEIFNIKADTPIGKWLTDTYNEVTQWFTDVGEAISGFFSNLWGKITDFWDDTATWFDENVVQPIVDFFAPIVDRVSEFFRGCRLIIEAVWETASDWFNDKVVEPIAGFFENLCSSVSGFFSELWSDVKDVWDIASTWFSTTVTEPIVNWFEGVRTKVSGFFSDLWSDVKDIWDGVASWFNKNVINPLVGFFSNAWTKIKDTFKVAFNGIRNFAVKILNGLIGGVESVINWVIDAINGLVGGFNKVVSWAADVLDEDWGGVTLIKRVELGRIPIETKANGGFVGAGQMFIAREAGPELVGNIGSRTAVANNDQIIEGIAAGVYRAVVSAMSDTNGQQNQNVNVYLDGKQIYASVKKTEAQRGRTLMGNQLGYSY